MKKNDCSMVRDLMPLVLDRVASDESRQTVEEHIASCADCRKQYEAMKAAMPAGDRAAYEEEQKQIMDALKAVRVQRWKRRIIAAALALIFCFASAFWGSMVYERQYLRASVLVENNLYTLRFAQLRDGRLVVYADTARLRYRVRGTGLIEPDEDGNLYCYLSHTPVISAGERPGEASETADWSTRWMVKASSFEDAAELRQGKPEDYVTIWTKGEPIPAASEEMEAYIDLMDQFLFLNRSSQAMQDDSIYQSSEYTSLWKKIREAYAAVPEWK